jgi:hypothetical protein
MQNVILYTKTGCHLCDEVKEALVGLTAVYPHRLTEIDITQDPVIFAQYHLTIPVVQVGEAELQAPITYDQLSAALATSK